MTRRAYDEALKKVHLKLLRMGLLLEKQYDDMIYSMERLDAEIAKRVIANDKAINEMDDIIENECIIYISRLQPVATDLRILTSTMEMITDLERMGDNCSDVANYILAITARNDKAINDGIIKMATIVREMFRDTIETYIERDSKRAIEIIERDDEVDRLFYGMVEELKAEMKENSALVDSNVDLIFIVKYFEKMADHLVNICNWVRYINSGVLSKHDSLDDSFDDVE